MNITVGAVEEREMLSGMHTVEDIFCCCCGQLLGWKYVNLLADLWFCAVIDAMSPAIITFEKE